ncbi:hypothetical protein [Aeromicrobium sp. UC242_57]|uniref:hypothetical protein n=1 Tax=Aeromicrobium sp. UC242_57 TaxID=3374624 RepID=UPI0037AB36AD
MGRPLRLLRQLVGRPSRCSARWLLGLIQALGLQRVDAPRGSATGEVWVRTDPRIDFELG